MLQEFLRRGKDRKMGRNLIQMSGRVPVLNLEFAHDCSGFQPTVENLPKGRHGSGGFFGGLLQWFFGNKMQKKIRWHATPPKSTSQGQKSAAKPTNKNPPVKPPSTCRVLFD